MRIIKGAIELKRLTIDDIELIRQKRNSEEIRSKMFIQKIISPQEQLAWFNKINNHLNYYFTISYRQKKIGLIHGKVLSFEHGIAEGGIFLWEKSRNSELASVKASLIMADLTFNILKLRETRAKVRTENKKVISYNKILGYKIVNQDLTQTEMTLTRDNYLHSSKKIKRALQIIDRSTFNVTWSEIIIEKWIPEWFDKLPAELKIKVTRKYEEAAI